MVGYIKNQPDTLVIVQGYNEDLVWIYGNNQTFLKSEFVEMKIHPFNHFYPHFIELDKDELAKIFGIK